ncbi:uncharacterized protein LY79DRAFT_573798 [Colletotrichum navitas]|uniref:Uncharacterized protein n=1 Tax=Colletotrichum navitas TaxID=681940 RepID=A0AAD8PJH4_9PEZI|nr:uncharacterized protein LY79DRAFT_573798 [Colletotrichum navitas]KAK1564002.1 hypothetical protein LY79DRAFT_573798 [Colletotrichum navitas]
MKFLTIVSALALATIVAADDPSTSSKKKLCINGCIKCYCGDIKYDDHVCNLCSCNQDAYKSTNASNPQGNCDQPGGFSVDCGHNVGGICVL